MKSGIKNVLIALLILGAAFLSHAAAKMIFSTSETTPQVNGYTLQRETFNSGCLPEARKSGAGEDAARMYCTCVYDSGLGQYGLEGWTAELEQLGYTNTLTAEMNDIVNTCAQLALDSGAM